MVRNPINLQIQILGPGSPAPVSASSLLFLAAFFISLKLLGRVPEDGGLGGERVFLVFIQGACSTFVVCALPSPYSDGLAAPDRNLLPPS